MNLDNLLDVYNAEGFKCSGSYVEGLNDITDDEIQDGINDSSDKLYRVIQQSDDIEYMRSDYKGSKGLIWHTRFFMWIFGNEPKEIVENKLKWLALTYSDKDGIITQFDSPKIIQDVKIWRFIPVGGVSRVAKKWGDARFYTNMQPIEFAGEQII